MKKFQPGQVVRRKPSYFNDAWKNHADNYVGPLVVGEPLSSYSTNLVLYHPGEKKINGEWFLGGRFWLDGDRFELVTAECPGVSSADNVNIGDLVVNLNNGCLGKVTRSYQYPKGLFCLEIEARITRPRGQRYWATPDQLLKIDTTPAESTNLENSHDGSDLEEQMLLVQASLEARTNQCQYLEKQIEDLKHQLENTETLSHEAFGLYLDSLGEVSDLKDKKLELRAVNQKLGEDLVAERLQTYQLIEKNKNLEKVCLALSEHMVNEDYKIQVSLHRSNLIRSLVYIFMFIFLIAFFWIGIGWMIYGISI